jgi:hypothetical protein
VKIAKRYVKVIGWQEKPEPERNIKVGSVIEDMNVVA